MKRLAIFVEGQTEQLFVERLVPAIVGKYHAHVVKVYSASGGRKPGSRTLTQVNAAKESGAEDYLIMIVNSGTDSRVASDVKDEYDSLIKAGYSAIIAIRDVYPLPSGDVGKLRSNLGYGIKTKPIIPLFILGIMELEAWFLAEHSHFERIHPALTPARILQDTGIDVVNGDMQARGHPAQDLGSIYNLEGLGYSKSASKIGRTVNAISVDHLYLSTRLRIPDLNRLFSELDLFFTKIAP